MAYACFSMCGYGFEFEVELAYGIYVEKGVQLDKEILINLGIISMESSGNVQIQTSVHKKGDSISIISGDIIWDMSQDHKIFLKMVTEFVSLYPFKDRLIPTQLTYKQLFDENTKLNAIVERLKIDIESYKQEINSLKQADSLIR